MTILHADVNRKDYPELPRDLPKGERVYLFRGHTNGNVPKWGTACLIDGHSRWVIVPTDALVETVGYKDKEGMQRRHNGRFSKVEPRIS